MAKGAALSGGEIVVSSIRAGMKREFAAMMKAQAECGISIGHRRVTRSQNVALSSGLVLKTLEGDKKSEGKRRKKVEQSVEVEKKGEERVDDGNLEGEEEVDGDNLEAAVAVMSEDDEPKSDIVDGNLEEDVKVEVAEAANENGDGGVSKNMGVEVDTESTVIRHLVEIENSVAGITEGFESSAARKIIETEKNVVEDDALEKGNEIKNEVETESNVIKEIASDIVNVIAHCETLDEEVKVVQEPVCEDLHKNIDIQDKELNSIIKEGKGFDNVVSGAEGNGDNDTSEKRLRRLTRSALKQAKGAAESSVIGDIKDAEHSETDAVSTMITPAKMELKISKRAFVKRVPLRLKQLLETGLLEGLRVQYVRGSKSKGRSETALKGVIKGSGILCYCDKCNGSEVLTPNQFELHAGSPNKRPPEYIYLENGNTLSDVLNICKNAPCDSLEQAIQNAVGSSNERRSTFCLNCKGPIPVAGAGRTMLLCDSCISVKEPQSSPTQNTDDRDRSSICVSNVKSSEQRTSGNPRTKSQGRLTRKDLRLHKLVFEEDVLPDGTALSYYSQGEKRLEGYKKGSGIFCYCCEKEVSPSVFEAHAGCGSRRKPYLNIYISNGVSLHELSIRLSKERKISAEENDDLCSICADGGDLMCCDTCPRAFHVDCVSLPSIPKGTWYCRYCENMFQKEKFVERNANAIAAGRVLGVDPLDHISKRCIRIVENLDVDICACVLCRGKTFSKFGFGPTTVIICDQCEKEYHIGCLKEHDMDDLKELPEGKWFCCAECNNVHTTLEKLVADGEMQIPELLLDMIKEKHAAKGSNDITDLDIRWRLLRGKLANEETRKLLSGAVTLFHERFDPIADANTSRLDLIPQMVYGRKFNDQDLGGMYTAVLFVNSVMVCAGIIRIFGKAIAELPLVATIADRQGQGYFQCLFSCIENLLGSLDVKDLLLPAAEEAESLWINKFGFKKITQEQLRDHRKDYQMMIFQGTSALQKPVPKSC